MSYIHTYIHTYIQAMYIHYIHTYSHYVIHAYSARKTTFDSGLPVPLYIHAYMLRDSRDRSRSPPPSSLSPSRYCSGVRTYVSPFYYYTPTPSPTPNPYTISATPRPPFVIPSLRSSFRFSPSLVPDPLPCLPPTPIPYTIPGTPLPPFMIPSLPSSFRFFPIRDPLHCLPASPFNAFGPSRGPLPLSSASSSLSLSPVAPPFPPPNQLLLDSPVHINMTLAAAIATSPWRRRERSRQDAALAAYFKGKDGKGIYTYKGEDGKGKDGKGENG